MNINYEPMNKKPATPKVGVGVFLFKGFIENSIPVRKILLGKRKGSHGEGKWSLPGGHMELGETFEETCKREVKEELNIDIVGVDKFGFMNNHFPTEGLHYITLFFIAKWDGLQKEMLMEPDSCEGWEWFDIRNLPKNVWSTIPKILLEQGYIEKSKKIA